jgi:biotin carboxylase
VPAFRVVGHADAAATAAREIGLPVVVKPVAGSGSVGVRLCATAEEVSAAAAALLESGVDERGAAREPRVLVEEFAVGPEYSVETIGGAVVGVTGKHLGDAPYFVETGHDFPAPLAAGDRAALAGAALRAQVALGLGWGAAHTELRLTARGPVLIEVNPRLAGGMITTVVAEATGVDLVDCCVALACGQPPELTPTRSRAASIRFLVADSPGTVTGVRGVAEAEHMPGVRSVSLSVAPGSGIAELTRSFRDRLGHVIAVGADAAESAARAASALAAIGVALHCPPAR